MNHLNEVTILRIIMFPSKSHRQSNKTLNTSHGKLPFELLIGEVQETPKIIQAIVLTLGFFPGLKGKTLLLKMPHTLDIELGGIEQKVTWEPPPLGLPLILVKVVKQAVK